MSDELVKVEREVVVTSGSRAVAPVGVVEGAITIRQVDAVGDILRAGHTLRGFLSGGGLRVIRIESLTGRLNGYGEAPNVEEAISMAVDDHRVGGRPYEARYFIGSRDTTSPLDICLRRGDKLYASVGDGGLIVVSISGYGQFRVPEELLQRVRDTGSTEIHENRGHVFRTSRDPSSGNTYTYVINQPSDGRDPWMWKETRTAAGETFDEAVASALAAELVEV